MKKAKRERTVAVGDGWEEEKGRVRGRKWERERKNIDQQIGKEVPEAERAREADSSLEKVANLMPSQFSSFLPADGPSELLSLPSWGKERCKKGSVLGRGFVVLIGAKP